MEENIWQLQACDCSPIGLYLWVNQLVARLHLPAMCQMSHYGQKERELPLLTRRLSHGCFSHPKCQGFVVNKHCGWVAIHREIEVGTGQVIYGQ